MRMHLAESSSYGYSLVTPRSGHWGASACFSACLIYSKCNIKDPLPLGGSTHDAVSSHYPNIIQINIHLYNMGAGSGAESLFCFVVRSLSSDLSRAAPENADEKRLGVISS